MNNKVENYNLQIFLEGENINLCIPTSEFALKSTWYNWFNDFRTTRFLRQGVFPNTPEKQLDFYNQIMASTDRLSLIISNKEQYIGTISLSFINLVRRTTDIAMLIGEKSQLPNADLYALEAMALMTEFAFEKMGIERISAGQHEKLRKWQYRLETIGYRVDGIIKNGFIKGSEVANTVKISIVKEDYLLILENRKSLWDSSKEMKRRVESIPSEMFIDKLRLFFETEGDKYYKSIFKS
ncbi:MAG TPA: GNAT family N-acetyltransferase [Chitinophagales bacterium]|nr:GNAT family N-acetyltransferase [Chitinophagales bacterium]